MRTTSFAAPGFSPVLSQRLFGVVSRVAAFPEVKAAVQANHDQNRWWPDTVADPRMRMLVAGWSTRVSYTMVEVYARVVADAASIGFDRLSTLPTEQLAALTRPIGLPVARIGYLRSLAAFLNRLAAEGTDPLTANVDSFIARFAAEVRQASFKVAQCAALYARGYHCGIIPVDSGMVTKLAPSLGVALPSTPVAHERMRTLLQNCVNDRPLDYLRLVEKHDYAVSIPSGSTPTWWTHLVLIYFKRLHLNRPGPRLCPVRPVCESVIDCTHSRRQP